MVLAELVIIDGLYLADNAGARRVLKHIYSDQIVLYGLEIGIRGLFVPEPLYLKKYLFDGIARMLGRNVSRFDPIAGLVPVPDKAADILSPFAINYNNRKYIYLGAPRR